MEKLSGSPASRSRPAKRPSVATSADDARREKTSRTDSSGGTAITTIHGPQQPQPQTAPLGRSVFSQPVSLRVYSGAQPSLIRSFGGHFLGIDSKNTWGVSLSVELVEVNQGRPAIRLRNFGTNLEPAQMVRFSEDKKKDGELESTLFLSRPALPLSDSGLQFAEDTVR